MTFWSASRPLEIFTCECASSEPWPGRRRCWWDETYAPPEQSEPAITSSRPWTIVANSEIPESGAWDEQGHFQVLGLDVMRGSTMHVSVTVGAGREGRTLVAKTET